MIRFGTISEIDPEKGLARVRFEEDDIVSAWLPITQRRTLSDKTMETLDINEHVACVMDENAEEGVIVGAIYNDEDLPEGGGADVWARKFKDGTVIKYDRSAKAFTMTLASGGSALVKAGTTEHKINESGHTVKRGSESVKKILEDLIDAILAETHSTGVGPSGPPLNAATYTAIKARIPQLFEG